MPARNSGPTRKSPEHSGKMPRKNEQFAIVAFFGEMFISRIFSGGPESTFFLWKFRVSPFQVSVASTGRSQSYGIFSTQGTPDILKTICIVNLLLCSESLNLLGVQKLTRSGLNGFWRGSFEDKFAFFEAYKSPIPKRSKLLAKRRFL